MSRPGGRLPAGDIRPPARQTRTWCGFCEGGHGQPRGVCQDVDGRCKGHLAGFRQGHQHQPRRLVDVRVLGRQGRHPAGSMCRFAVQSVLARPLWNISALARAEDAASSRSISRARRRIAAASGRDYQHRARWDGYLAVVPANGEARRAASRGDRPLAHSITFVARLARNRLHPSFLGSSTVSSLSRVGHPPAHLSRGIHATGAKSGQSHRSPLAFRGNYWVACALRFASVRSSGFRIPCRERAVELVGGGGRTGDREWGPVRPGAHVPLKRPGPATAQSRASRSEPRTGRHRGRVLPPAVCAAAARDPGHAQVKGETPMIRGSKSPRADVPCSQS